MGAGFSSCTPRVICSRVSAPILVDEATSSDGKLKTRRRTVHELIQDRCPSMYASFKPVWWLCNGHLQTFYSVLGDFTKVDQVVYDRVLLKLRDSGTIGLDFSPPKHENRSFAEDTPVVVVLHGLTGGSYESYIRTILSSAIATVEEGGLGYRAVVINSRGCAGVPLTSPHLYSSGRTTDIRAALLYIQHLYPNAPLLGIGFSMGAGVLTKYLSEEGQESRLVSACAVAAPWDMLAMNDRLTNDFFCRNVYSKALARNCQAILVQHASEIAQWPESHLARVFPTVCGNKSLTAVEFDELVSRVVGGPTPPWPLEDALAYYAYVSTDQYLPQVRVPFLSLDAEDDPIATGTPVHCTNPWVVFVKTAIGGHVGWFAHEDGSIKRWLRKPVLEWLRATGEGMRVEKRKPRDVICRDGWLIDAGAEEIGVYVSSSASSVLPPEPDSRSALLAGL